MKIARNESCSIFKMKYLFIFIAVFSTAFAQDDEEATTDPPTTTGIPIIFLSDEADQFTWSPKSESFILIEADEGYKIGINVTDCNIDGENGEYATITTDELTYGLTFTYSVSDNPSYLYNSNRLLADFFGTDASNFTVVFTRVGQRLSTTTTEIPMTTISLPTPGENISSTLQVYLEGNTIHDLEFFNVKQLRDAIAAMAVEYCTNENFPVDEDITSDNVLIKNLMHCPPNWPNAEFCIDLTFAVPVNLIEDRDSLWTGYQMTTEHLRIMWSRYANSYLPDGITIYSAPDMAALKWGLLTASVIIVVFAIVMAVVRYLSVKIAKKMRKRRSFSDTTSIISTSDRNSAISLSPHHLQEVPEFFEKEYWMHDPANSEPSYAHPVEYEYNDMEPDIGIQQLSNATHEESSRA